MKKIKVVGIVFLACLLSVFSTSVYAGDDEGVNTPQKLARCYKEVIDDWNQNMIAGNQDLYQEMTNGIQLCAMSGNYVMGSFMSQYLYLLHNDFVSLSKNDTQAISNTNTANHYKQAMREMIMFYNNGAKDKNALPRVLKKTRNYYLKTKTRFTKNRK